MKTSNTMKIHRTQLAWLTGVGLSSALMCAADVTAADTPAWTMKQGPLMTAWAKQVDPAKPLPEYPRPQLTRDKWLNLNGIWQYQPGAESDATPIGKTLTSSILVPFPVESAISGVMEHHDRLWYRRSFTVPAAWAGKRVILHCDAIDYESEVFLNGTSLGIHKGGYETFSLDLTDHLKVDGEQELIVRVFDPTDLGGQPRGKQTTKPGGIMYTPCTGIWKTVWIEPVASVAIDRLTMIPDIDAKTMTLTVHPTDAKAIATAKVVIKDGNTVVATIDAVPGVPLSIPIPDPKLWSPETPFLYDVEVTLHTSGVDSDHIGSYFGMRKISVDLVEGHRRLMLNNKNVFQFGPLDQGYWPDGNYTAPTDAALKSDIEATKAAGFNMVRKHIKVEPDRWYYWADKLGILVWQDMPSMNSYLPKKATPPELDKAQFATELALLVKNHLNSPAIIMWVVFNETQGQHDTEKLVAMVQQLDPHRLVNQASGDWHFGVGDVFDIHSYPMPGCPKSDTQVLVCGEYGGIGLKVADHTWKNGGFSYNECSSSSDLLDLYSEYADMVKRFRDERGLSAAVYTQVTDVETELNGFLTYDRIPKAPLADFFRATHFQIPQPTYRPVLPTSEGPEAQTWKFTIEKPKSEWNHQTFDDASWSEGKAGFGKPGTPGLVLRTEWKTPDIWLRKTFNPGALTAEQIAHLMVRNIHDDIIEIFINGELAYDNHRFINAYELRTMHPKARAAIVPNADNVIAVHCHDNGSGSSIDVGIYERIPDQK